MNIKNLKIGPRLAIGFILIFLLTICVDIFTIMHMEDLSNLTTKLYKHPFTVSKAILRIKCNIIAMHRSMKDVTLATDTIEIIAVTNIVNDYEKKVYKDFEILNKRFLGNKIKVKNAQKLFSDWKIIREEVISLMYKGNKIKAIAITKGKGAKHVEKLNTDIEEFVVFAQAKADSFLKNAETFADKAITISLIILICTLIIGILLSIFITLSITRPINKIISYFDPISKGELDIKINIDSKDEIGILANAFNKMVNDLKNIIVSKSYVDNIIKSMVDSLIVIDPDTTIKIINQATLDLLGYKEYELIGKHIGIIFAAAEEEEEELFKISVLEELLKEGFISNVEKTYISKQYKRIPVLFSGSVMRNKEGKLIGIVIVARDMRETKRLINELTKSKEEIEIKAQELETYVYTVSHDLKSPLVSLDGFSSILLEEYKDKLDVEGLHYLERLRFNVQQMSNLITDLLELTRIGRVVGTMEFIDMEEILNIVKEEFENRLDKRKIKLNVISPLPKPWGDRNRIRQVFENLIDNAIQYMGNQNIPKIEVGVIKNKNDFYQFYVKDNGIGIHENYYKIIFQLFQRLGDIKSEGTGIGLTIFKRIIENHNGNVWVESKEGKGSTFYFTLPKRELVHNNNN